LKIRRGRRDHDATNVCRIGLRRLCSALRKLEIERFERRYFGMKARRMIFAFASFTEALLRCGVA
jgi:hypothetical protein